MAISSPNIILISFLSVMMVYVKYDQRRSKMAWHVGVRGSYFVKLMLILTVR